MRRMKALIIEDDAEQATFLGRCLYDSGFTCETVHDGVRGWERLQVRAYDLAIVDIVLPGLSGLELIRRTRERRIATPIIVVSSMGDVADKVAGLNAGADDYLGKPFSRDELLARAAAVVRRGNPSPVDDVIRYRDLVLDPRSHHVRRGDVPIELTAYEYRLLEHLLRHQGRILSPAIIAEAIWGLATPPQSKSVATRVYTLRKKLRVGNGPDIIENARGFGYFVRPER